MILSKLTTAIRMIRNDGPLKFINFVSFRYLPPNIFNTMALITKERALPYPTRGGNWKIIQFPEISVKRKVPAITTAHYVPHGSKKHLDIIEKIYRFNDFVEIEANDIVVDVGAYIGSFSSIASHRAEVVIAIDPLAAIDDSLKSNLSNYNNVIVIPKAAWKDSGEININLSTQPNENSIFAPDSRETGEAFQASAETVPQIARDNGFEKIDYLKVEAEGVEPEILEAALNDNMPIRKIAVDAGAERDGQPVTDEIIDLFDEYGYVWRIKNEEIAWGENIVFGKKEV